MKLLIISDVHANLAALEAVLAAEPHYDRLVCLGDTVDYGPDPVECLERLRTLDPVWVRGNHDHAVGSGVECGCSEAFQALSRASRRFTRAALGQDDLAFLRGLPISADLTVTGGAAVRRFHLTHAAPDDNLYGYVAPDGDGERWREAMASVPASADAVLTGHTHRPYQVTHPRPGDRPPLVIVNPGSVGQPRDDDPRAAYAVWEEDRFALRRVAYDIERTVKRLAASGQPDDLVAALTGVLRRGGAA